MAAPKIILLVEDEFFLAETIGMRLQSWGYQVVMAADGTEAFRQVERYDVDLILMDYMLPGDDGVAITTKLRANTKFQFVPIVFVSARGQAVDRERAISAGANDYVVKPFDVERMHEVITKWIRA